jgi:hypothetical protein
MKVIVLAVTEGQLDCAEREELLQTAGERGKLT